MTEERGKRDDQSEDLSTPNSATPDGADSAGSAAARPTGKKAARRTRTAGDSAEKVSITKSPSARTSVATREKAREPKRPNIFKRLIQFLREVIAELRKVIWPNRKQMITYTSVVLVFVAFMVAFISGLDLGFTQGIEWLFG
ncbi:preprotein translocase subunit SecE [Rhodococcus sp. P1Y]|uniref:preprotein translocase subunit SecE n=1 Tax=Rhodococcus sp. P1Y TaxID=1302308 RepID=UPI000EADF3E7|nr:preprotein translocase subunit SecE [Rhodococcus sp. P1Y]AYJ50989.1 preprotein translocase subunit SecE [Rhodococcus sp. P1Y]